MTNAVPHPHIHCAVESLLRDPGAEHLDGVFVSLCRRWDYQCLHGSKTLTFKVTGWVEAGEARCKPVPVTAEDAVAVIRIIEAAFLSSQQQKVVRPEL